MTRAIAHRGPDGEGFHVAAGIGLGHRRLSIIDLSSAGTQPMSNEDGTVWVAYNGEIYNHAELRAKLVARDHVFRSRSDTEVIVHLYEERGADLVNDLRGMFAFALWDARRERLLLARDRIGIKPLFLYEGESELRFGSEIKSLLADPEIPRDIDPLALDAYLSQNYVAAPATLLRRIRQLEPGELLEFGRGRTTRRRRYWDLTFPPVKERCSTREWEERLEEELRRTLRSHLMADVPYGAMLSAGVDSTTLVGLLVQEHAARTLTFTADFRERTYGEGAAARATAMVLGAENHQVVFEAPTVEVLRKIVHHSEEPTADLAMPAFFAVCGLARKHVTVALSGEGADELFAGYETYTASLLASQYRRLPSIARSAIRHAIQLLPDSETKISAVEKAKRFVRGVEAPGENTHLSWRRICEPELRQRLLVDSSDGRTWGADAFSRCASTDPLERMQYVDQRYYLPNCLLVKADRMSMAHGLEIRVPYLDHVMVELAAAMPPDLKLRHWVERKWIFRRVASRILPRSIQIPRKKRGFNLPMSQWLRGPLRDATIDLLAPTRVARIGLLRPDVVESVMNDHLQGRRDRSFELYGLLLLSLWSDEVGSVAAPLRSRQEAAAVGAHHG